MIGCASDPVIIEPQGKDVVWNQGLAYSESMSNNIQLKAAFVNNTNCALIYDVDVKNLSSEDVTLSPTDFQLSGTALDEPTFAINPELEIKVLGTMIDDEKSRIGGNGFEVAANIMSSFSRIISGESVQERQLRLESEEYQARMDQASYAEIKELRYKKNNYETTFLRKTTLKPFESLQGRIEFKSSLKAGSLQLSFAKLENVLSLKYIVRDY